MSHDGLVAMTSEMVDDPGVERRWRERARDDENDRALNCAVRYRCHFDGRRLEW